MRRAASGLASALARLLLRVFFREIEIAGEVRMPAGTPLLLVANHVNSVVDPLLLLGFVAPRARMLAKSTLFRHPVMAPLLWLVRALPVYRRQDAGENPADNLKTFKRCHEALAQGGTIALFPEGRSHNQPHALPLKTGAARIALEAEHLHGPLGLRVVAIGLTYEAKSRFRSRVLVRIGAPLDPAPELAGYARAARGSVRQLTARIAAELESLTINYASWEQALLVNRVAGLVGGDTPLSARAALWQRVVDGYHALERSDAGRVASLVERIEGYDRRLAQRGLEDADVAGGARAARLRRRADAVMGPLGRLLNALPFAVTSRLTSHLTRTADETATYALLGGLVFFPVSWLVQGLILGLGVAPAAGAAAAVLAPLTGPAALRDYEARSLRQRLGRWPPPGEMAALRAERSQLASELLALAATLEPGSEAERT